MNMVGGTGRDSLQWPLKAKGVAVGSKRRM
jgi:hypothetical protein